MSDKDNNKINTATNTGTIWIIGWLFTIGFVDFTIWQILLALLIWPYYLGSAVAG